MLPSFSLLVFDRRDFLLYYDVTDEHLDAWMKDGNGGDAKECLGSLFLPLLAANKSMKMTLDNGLTSISGKRENLVLKKYFGCTLVLCGSGSILQLSHVLHMSVKVNFDITKK
jgi:hypothetical protein